MSRGFPLIPLAVVDRRDRTGGRAHLSRAERLPPFVEEVAQRVGALNGRLDGDDAVRGVGVQPVEAAAAGDEGALRGVLGLGAGIPIPAGTWRGEPLTKMVRWAWMWKMVCSLRSHLMPSTSWPDAVAVLASGAAFGIGTPSGPSVPGAGARLRVPRVLSAASLSSGVPPPAALGPPPLVTASVMPTAAAMTTAAAPVQAAQMRRRPRRASRALIWAIFSRACRLFLLPLGISTCPSTSLSPKEDRLQFTNCP